MGFWIRFGVGLFVGLCLALLLFSGIAAILFF